MPATSKVIYKPDSQSTEEFTVVVNTESASPIFKKWKAGDKYLCQSHLRMSSTVRLSFQVFVSTQGAQGVLGKPSNQQLDTVFETHKDVDVVTIILEKGREQSTDGVTSSTFTGSNVSRGNNDRGGPRV
ncbi:SBDS domain-containing protein [Mycena indigotica]|uniref:SBDS domain-containing protein n=1 Tax=Mycena indigotica TaxID=2126181 RepID=A0A8H6W4Z0_9AGAR|nr:SBDS domain-containing protein [Mycena indigotica]KAF7301968.1 SBDS domain-containing protein [Mycena indigotica]